MADLGLPSSPMKGDMNLHHISEHSSCDDSDSATSDGTSDDEQTRETSNNKTERVECVATPRSSTNSQNITPNADTPTDVTKVNKKTGSIDVFLPSYEKANMQTSMSKWLHSGAMITQSATSHSSAPPAQKRKNNFSTDTETSTVDVSPSLVAARPLSTKTRFKCSGDVLYEQILN